MSEHVNFLLARIEALTKELERHVDLTNELITKIANKHGKDD